jgi:hypothetical protein
MSHNAMSSLIQALPNAVKSMFLLISIIDQPNGGLIDMCRDFIFNAGIILPAKHDNDIHYLLKLFANRISLYKQINTMCDPQSPCVADITHDWHSIQRKFRFLLHKRNEYTHGCTATRADIHTALIYTNDLLLLLNSPLAVQTGDVLSHNSELSEAVTVYEQSTQPYILIK